MRPLSQTEIDRQRDLQEIVMPDLCTIQRFTLTADGMGGYGEAWNPAETVPCSLHQITRTGMRENMVGAQAAQTGDWYITMPFDTQISAKDRCVINGRSYEVTFVPAHAYLQTALRVEARAFNEELRI